MELMIVVAIVAILAAIAFPSFREQVRASRRADALAEAGRVQLAMERWRADNPSYVSNATNAATYPAAVSSPTYAFALSGQTASTYTLVGTPRGSQASDRCGTLTAGAGGSKPVWLEPSCR